MREEGSLYHVRLRKLGNTVVARCVGSFGEYEAMRSRRRVNSCVTKPGVRSTKRIRIQDSYRLNRFHSSSVGVRVRMDGKRAVSRFKDLRTQRRLRAGSSKPLQQASETVVVSLMSFVYQTMTLRIGIDLEDSVRHDSFGASWSRLPRLDIFP